MLKVSTSDFEVIFLKLSICKSYREVYFNLENSLHPFSEWAMNEDVERDAQIESGTVLKIPD